MSDTASQIAERRSGREKKESARIKEAKDDDWVNKLIRFDGRTRGPRASIHEANGAMATTGSSGGSPMNEQGDQRQHQPRRTQQPGTLGFVKTEPPHLDLSQAYISSSVMYHMGGGSSGSDPNNAQLQRSRPLPVPARPASTPTTSEYELHHHHLSSSSQHQQHQQLSLNADSPATAGAHATTVRSASVTASGGAHQQSTGTPSSSSSTDHRRRSTPRTKATSMMTDSSSSESLFAVSPRVKRTSPGDAVTAGAGAPSLVVGSATATTAGNGTPTALSGLLPTGLVGLSGGRLSPLVNFDPSAFTDSNGSVTSSSIPEVVPCQVDCLYEDEAFEDSACSWLGDSSLFVPLYCQHLLPASSAQRSFYPAISISGSEYQLFDNIVLRPAQEGMIEGVARIIALFQEEGQKCLFVEWYYRKVDIVAHLNQVKAAEEASKNSWNMDTEEGNGDEISGANGSNGFAGATMPKRAARRGRPPKKRRCNIEESLQALQLAPDHEIWTAPRPFLSIISVSSVQSPALVDHQTHLQPPPTQIIDPPSSPSAPPKFVYRKAYDHKTCHLSYCKPRSTQPPQLNVSLSSPLNSARLSSSSTSIPSVSSSPVMGSISISARGGSQTHRSTGSSSSSSGHSHYARTSRASKTDSLIDSPRIWMDDSEVSASPSSPKLRKTKEVDHHAVHRQQNGNGSGHGHHHQQQQHHQHGHQHHFMLSQSADGAYRHPSVEQMDVTGGGGNGSGNGGGSVNGGSASTGEIPLFQPMHYHQPAAFSSMGYGGPMQHSHQPTYMQSSGDYLMSENKPIVGGMRGEVPDDYSGSSQFQAPAAAPSLPYQRGPAMWGNANRENEIAYLRARVDQMTEAFATMQQTLTDLRDSVQVLQRQSQMGVGVPSHGLPSMHQQHHQNQLPAQNPSQQASLPMHHMHHSSMMDVHHNQMPGQSQGTMIVPMNHVALMPQAPPASQPLAMHPSMQAPQGHDFGVAVAAPTYVHMEQDSFVSTRELKDESYESPMDDFSCSSETATSSARSTLNTPSSKFLSDRISAQDNPPFSTAAPTPTSLNPVSDLNFDHFFIEHVGAQ